MARKIDVAQAPHIKGARYPMPYDEPARRACAGGWAMRRGFPSSA
jgi:hypothetical protein